VGYEKSFQKTTIDFLLSCPTSSEDFVSRSVIAKNTQEEELDTKENTVDASLVFIKITRLRPQKCFGTTLGICSWLVSSVPLRRIAKAG